jgi:hypothetical protein
MPGRLQIADMPAWPRFLSRVEAAAYVGVSTGLFDTEVAAGLWPEPQRRGAQGGRITWDKLAIDRAADQRSGLQDAEVFDEDEEIGRKIAQWRL